MLSSSPWHPVRGLMGMLQSRIRGLSELTLANIPGRVVKHSDRLPREVVEAASLSVLKRHLDNALNNML